MKSPEIKQQACKLYATRPDLSIADICAACGGISHSTLARWTGNGHKGRARGPKRLTTPDARSREILRCAAVLPQARVAEKFGCTRAEISRIVKRWRDWKPYRYKPGDVIRWKRRVFIVLWAGPTSGTVRAKNGDVITDFGWNMGGEQAVVQPK